MEIRFDAAGLQGADVERPSVATAGGLIDVPLRLERKLGSGLSLHPKSLISRILKLESVHDPDVIKQYPANWFTMSFNDKDVEAKFIMRENVIMHKTRLKVSIYVPLIMFTYLAIGYLTWTGDDRKGLDKDGAIINLNALTFFSTSAFVTYLSERTKETTKRNMAMVCFEIEKKIGVDLYTAEAENILLGVKHWRELVSGKYNIVFTNDTIEKGWRHYFKRKLNRARKLYGRFDNARWERDFLQWNHEDMHINCLIFYLTGLLFAGLHLYTDLYSFCESVPITSPTICPWTPLGPTILIIRAAIICPLYAFGMALTIVRRTSPLTYQTAVVLINSGIACCYVLLCNLIDMRFSEEKEDTDALFRFFLYDLLLANGTLKLTSRYNLTMAGIVLIVTLVSAAAMNVGLSHFFTPFCTLLCTLLVMVIYCALNEQDERKSFAVGQLWKKLKRFDGAAPATTKFTEMAAISEQEFTSTHAENTQNEATKSHEGEGVTRSMTLPKYSSGRTSVNLDDDANQFSS
ncbi:hypothetical protein HDU76_000545 [Blyttiomyces sp. JEL0837]|nr:hypothetical protein HDU76_000545 [Blyttiomyces sp. JEL0837]